MSARSREPDASHELCRVVEDGVSVRITVTPRASRSKLLGVHAGALKIALAAPPVDGAANEELRSVLAKMLDVPKRAIAILHGDHARAKTVLIRGVDRARVLSLLEEHDT